MVQLTSNSGSSTGLQSGLAYPRPSDSGSNANWFAPFLYPRSPLAPGLNGAGSFRPYPIGLPTGGSYSAIPTQSSVPIPTSSYGGMPWFNVGYTNANPGYYLTQPPYSDVNYPVITVPTFPEDPSPNYIQNALKSFIQRIIPYSWFHLGYPYSF